MTYSVQSSDQVVAFLQRLAPEQRRLVRRAIGNLRTGAGDIRPLNGSLEGYYRIRAGRFRIIFTYRPNQAIDAAFVEDRRIVYDVFEAEFIRRLKEASARYPRPKLEPSMAARRRRTASGGSHKRVSR